MSFRELTTVPEKLHLLYPKVLSGRFEISSNINSTVEVQPYRAPRQIDIEEVRRLVSVCLRLETVASIATRNDVPNSPVTRSIKISQSPLQSPTLLLPQSPSPVSPRSIRGSGYDNPLPLGAPISRQHRQSSHIDDQAMLGLIRRQNTASAVGQDPLPAVYLGPQIREDMTDDELLVVMESLVTRMENSLSSIVSTRLFLG